MSTARLFTYVNAKIGHLEACTAVRGEMQSYVTLPISMYGLKICTESEAGPDYVKYEKEAHHVDLNCKKGVLEDLNNGYLAD